ncbi:MAG: glycine cleavage system aminomethyltransferase GcvT [Nitrospinaceae bacterium]
MSQEPSEQLKSTPLAGLHRELGGRLVPFAGWHMPIQFEGVVQEHLCVRRKVGLFDISHMGEIDIRGEDSKKLLQRLLTNDIEKMSDGSTLYSLMCYDNGGVVDDLLVYRFSEDHYFLCVNASNADKDYQWIVEHSEGFKAQVTDIGPETAQLAVQGKDAENLLQNLSDVPLNDLKYYHFKKGKIHYIECIISRTGYTGEDGFELYLESGKAVDLCRKLLEAGEPFGIRPIGLGARDTLRLEMGYALYGNEIDQDTSPLEAGLGWVIKLKKQGFIGQQALQNQKERGLSRKLVGIRLLERGVPRSHYRVLKEGRPVGEITSGTFSPSLNTGIGLCYVSMEHSDPGSRLDVEIRSQTVPAEVVKPPFVPSHVKK